MTTSVIKATEKDAGAIALLNSQFRDAFDRIGQPMPFPKYYSEDWVLEEIAAGNQFVLQNGSGVLGALCLYQAMEGMPKNEAYIESLAISPDKQHKGMGRMLVEFAKRKSREEGKSILTVESFCIYEVQDFYIKCGFTLEPELGEYFGYKCYEFSMEL